MNFLLYLGIGYLLGSIPFALVIGKVFYKTDVREHGSGNLGGTNTGRVLGKKAGLMVIICDVLKVVLAVAIVSYFHKSASIWAGLAAAIGHCYPIFAKFKGGKAVATMFGFLISTAIFTFSDILYVLLPFLCFIIILKISKMVSLSSICAALFSSIYISFMQQDMQIIIASWLLTLLILYRHKSNIKNIIQGNERKITWM
ncbi:MAG: glycerol-3-phosphate 1-O-acyltransferase PlsY [Erysipelotrichaceae bacterium]|nr:glycerol-3-phosphate 1-O-acyltransferase PlsY [Erysipelotrichaceae bacterium]